MADQLHRLWRLLRRADWKYWLIVVLTLIGLLFRG